MPYSVAASYHRALTIPRQEVAKMRSINYKQTYRADLELENSHKACALRSNYSEGEHISEELDSLGRGSRTRTRDIKMIFGYSYFSPCDINTSVCTNVKFVKLTNQYLRLIPECEYTAQKSHRILQNEGRKPKEQYSLLNLIFFFNSWVAVLFRNGGRGRRHCLKWQLSISSCCLLLQGCWRTISSQNHVPNSSADSPISSPSVANKAGIAVTSMTMEFAKEVSRPFVSTSLMNRKTRTRNVLSGTIFLDKKISKSRKSHKVI